MDFRTQPIPNFVNDAFKKRLVPIEESGEDLVSIRNLRDNQVVSDSMYYKQGITGALEQCYIRKGVASLLKNAAALLPMNYKLIIWDGWRPFLVQKHLYDTYYKQLAAANLGYTTEELKELTSKYVSKPSIDKKQPAPHITGGSVDLAILDENDMLLNFGTEFDDFSEKAKTRFFEEKEEQGVTLAKQDKEILQNRRLLYHVMTSVGFTNYPEEWWHFDYGNQWWAQLKGKPTAIYGLVEQ
ncbi:M15 family metallopeptidase [Aquibacillus kalidii]|uniref:M15 family metallopeptidase n=1 Tax=Aquibacillus kalidii TaxID=2762597 RepID=UPI001648E7EF|nr:M15 family metallopeptidase [Aquibacillus kalidii]